jgi:DNA repair exonuclease SbcCD nuclease subunit
MAKKLLLVGDVHATVEELPECEKLLQYISQIVEGQHVDYVCFLGDQFNTHENVRVEVSNFWDKWFCALSNYTQVYALVGNHDQVGPGSRLNSMSVHRAVSVVDAPMFLSEENESCVILSPHFYDNEEFVAKCNQIVTDCGQSELPTLICHQTFNGVKYENGFFAPEGVEPKDLKFKQIISGHIHSPQTFANVTYIGAPRWRTANDTSIEERNLWLFDVAPGQPLTVAKLFPTSKVCTRIVTLTDTEAFPITEFNQNCKYVIDIRGSMEFCKRREQELKAENVKINIFPNKAKVVKVRESEGIAISYSRYLESYKPKYGTSLEKLKEISKERFGEFFGQ